MYCGIYVKAHFNRKFCSLNCKDAYDYRVIIGTSKCHVCGVGMNVIRGKRLKVPVCSAKCSSKLLNKGMTAQYLFSILDDLGAEGIREARFEGLVNDRTGAALRIDFYSPKFNLAVEYQGEQHFREVPFFQHKESDSLENRVYRDSIKRNYFKNTSITYVEWSYSTPVNTVNVINMLKKIPR